MANVQGAGVPDLEALKTWIKQLVQGGGAICLSCRINIHER